MLKENVLKYYLEHDCNCAESLSRGANETYDLGLDENALRALGGFGAGCYSGRLCGACAGSIAAISAKYIKTRAHKEDLACARVNEFVEAFRETLGSDLCCDLKEKFYDESLDDCRCIKTVELAAEVLEAKMAKFMAEDEASSKIANAAEKAVAAKDEVAEHMAGKA